MVCPVVSSEWTQVTADWEVTGRAEDSHQPQKIKTQQFKPTSPQFVIIILNIPLFLKVACKMTTNTYFNKLIFKQKYQMPQFKIPPSIFS